MSTTTTKISNDVLLARLDKQDALLEKQAAQLVKLHEMLKTALESRAQAKAAPAATKKVCRKVDTAEQAWELYFGDARPDILYVPTAELRNEIVEQLQALRATSLEEGTDFHFMRTHVTK